MPSVSLWLNKTNTMGFISPLIAAIAAGITIPALVTLYFLKLKRKRMVIPSTLLWQRAVQDLQVNSPFQKIKNNLLLWIQLLLLIALLLAMARPTQNAIADPGRRIVIVIDNSASMNAQDPSLDGDSRLEAAKQRALDVVDNLAAGNGEDGTAGGAMVVTFGHRAMVRQDFTTDLAKVRKAIRDIEPTHQRSFLDSAISTIEPFARQGGSEDKLTVHIFTDGRSLRTTDEPLSLVNADLKYHRLGDMDAPLDNLALVALSARRDFDKPQLVQVFARLANYGPEPIVTNLTLTIDGTAVRVERVSVPPAGEGTAQEPLGKPGQSSVTFDFIYPGMATVRVGHDHADLLAADDNARLILAPSRELRVLLVTPGNDYLELAAKSAGIQDLIQMSPAQYEALDPAQLRRGRWDTAGVAGAGIDAEGDAVDVIIFDRYSPKAPPLVNSLYFAAIPPLEGLSRRPTPDSAPSNELISQWDRSSELLNNVILSDIPLRRPGRLVVPNDGRVLAVGREGPVIAELSRDGVRHVMVSFDLYESLWPHRVSFPTFIQNTLPTLGLDGGTDSSGLSYRTGENATLVLATPIEELTYTGPVELTGRAVGSSITVQSFPFTGLYETDAAVDPRHRQLAVNLLDANESDLRPAEQLVIGTSSVAGQAQSVEIRKELWPWFVWAGLAFLVIEWLVYTRRMHI